MKQITKLIITSIITIVMSVPGYAAVSPDARYGGACDIAVIDAGMELKMALDKAVDALPEKAVYDRTRQALIEANQFTIENVRDKLIQIKSTLAYARLNAPADQVKVLDGLQENFDDLQKAHQELSKHNFKIGAPLIGGTIAAIIGGIAALEYITD